MNLATMARVLGQSEADLGPMTRSRIAACDFRFHTVEGEARDAVILDVLRALDADLSVSGPERIGAWEHGWGDILDRFEAAHGNPSALRPHYFRPTIMRVGGRYVKPLDGSFEVSFGTVALTWLAENFIGDAKTIYEFGCGPGHNLVELARLLTGRRLVGLDWARASQQILDRVRPVRGNPIEGRHFDMFHPGSDVEIEPGAAILTVQSMEQLGSGFEPFLDFLLASDASVVAHLEPIYELYDRGDLLDDLAARYSERRGYLRGYLPRLQELEREGRIELLLVQRHMGSLFHDGWTSVIWRKTRPWSQAP